MVNEPARAPGDAPQPTHGLVADDVEDSSRLLSYALEAGAKVDRRISETLYWAGQALNGRSIAPWQKNNPDQPIGVGFQSAYRDLSALLSPVTARTLKDTSDEFGRVFLSRGKVSEARIWSRKLWLITAGVILFIVGTENYDAFLLDFYPADELEGEGVPLRYAVRSIALNIMPFAYGCLGACAYLLRSCHGFIAARSFDRKRIPEYLSRLVLGVIAGGTILFFAESIIQDGQVINLESKALAFLAGYNIDFLFSAMERVAEAILPKVGIESVRRRARPQPAPVSVEELTRQLGAAKDPKVREVLEDLINRYAPDRS